MNKEEIRDDGAGFVSYHWDTAPAGVIDAFSGGTALIGIDEAMRFFNRRQSNGFRSANYDIPVKTGEGSWIAVILGILSIPAVAFTSAYAKKAGEKMAERDFANIGMKDVAEKSMGALVKFFKIMKHVGGQINWSQVKIHWKNNATVAVIINKDGGELEVPSEYIKWYKSLPSNIIKK